MSDAMYVSPAPIVSTTSTGTPGISTISSPSEHERTLRPEGHRHHAGAEAPDRVEHASR